jgi:mitogen-activated protein kinase kinase 3
LDSRTSITINEKTFSIEADDLESLCVLGRGAYGVVEKVKHKQTGTILAVKVIDDSHVCTTLLYNFYGLT